MTAQQLARMETDKLWDLWTKKPSQEVKDELVIRYISVVEQVAGKGRYTPVLAANTQAQVHDTVAIHLGVLVTGRQSCSLTRKVL